MPFNFVKKLRAIEDVDMDLVTEEDHDPRKINASHHCYRTEMGFPWVLPIVKEIEKVMAKDESQTNIIQIPCFGEVAFRNAVTELVLGKQNIRVQNGQVLTVQTLSGIGALRLISDLAFKQLKIRQVYIPSSTYDRMNPAFLASGFPPPKTYRYYNHSKHGLDMEGMLEDLRMIPEDSLVVFYSCCHNPTGCDPSMKQWKSIAETISPRLFPVVDLSYQGLASGDPDLDAFPVRLFARLGFEMAVTVTFAHNFLLYNERVGAGMFLLRHADDVPALKSHLATMINTMYGSPPYHGAKIVTTVLKTPKYYDQWLGYLKKIKDQVQRARNHFVDTLVKYHVPGDWDYIKKGTGMSTFTNLTERQVQHLILYHHVYIRKNNSLNVGALNDYKIEYIAAAIADCIKEYPASEEIDPLV